LLQEGEYSKERRRRNKEQISLQIEKEDRNPVFGSGLTSELRFTRAVSRRGLAVKKILGLLAFNVYQLMGLMGTMVNFNFRAGGRALIPSRFQS